MGGQIMPVLLILILAGLAVPVLRSLLSQGRESVKRLHVERSGALAIATIVEVTVVEEGSDDGEHMLGGTIPVSVRFEGKRQEAALPRYRVLVRFTPPGHAQVVADLTQELSTAQLNALLPDSEIEIRYDPTNPERIALDPGALRRAIAQARVDDLHQR